MAADAKIICAGDKIKIKVKIVCRRFADDCAVPIQKEKLKSQKSLPEKMLVLRDVPEEHFMGSTVSLMEGAPAGGVMQKPHNSTIQNIKSLLSG